MRMTPTQWLSLGLLLVPATSGARDPVSLGSFTIANHPERVPDWYSIDHLPLDTSGWTQTDVTDQPQVTALGGGCNAVTPNDGGNDRPNLQCMLDNVPVDSVLFFPAGQYDFTDSTVSLRQSRVVLRGSGETTIFEHGFTSGSMLSVSPASGSPDSQTSFDGPYSIGTNTIDAGNAGGYANGDVVVLSAWPKPDSPRWSHVQYPGTTYQNQTYGLPVALAYVAVAQNVNGNQITIDRPLREDWSTATTRTINRGNMLSQIGIEGIHFRHATPTVESDRMVQLSAVTDSWITDCRFGPTYKHMLSITGLSSRNLVRDNHFDRLAKPSGIFNNAAVIVSRGASDNVVENNVFTNLWRSVLLEDGAVGNVLAYNFHAEPTDPGIGLSQYCERSFFFHGDYNRANLVEGNHTYCKIEIDAWWGRQGPNNTVYRNRIAPQKVCFDAGNNALFQFCTTLADCSGAASCEEIHWAGITAENEPKLAGSHIVTGGFNVLGNIAPSFHGRPMGNRAASSGVFDWPEGSDHDVRMLWVEGNVFRSHFKLNTNDGDPATDCGTDTGKSDCPGDNAVQDAAPASWQSNEFLNVPASLYRSAPPPWWCDEACSFSDAYRGIGAFGDNLDPAQLANLCKLPAQIRHEGGACNGGMQPDGGPTTDGATTTDGGPVGDGSGPGADPGPGPDGGTTTADGVVGGCGCTGSAGNDAVVFLAVLVAAARRRKRALSASPTSNGCHPAGNRVEC